jgi:hypothetical protein
VNPEPTWRHDVGTAQGSTTVEPTGEIDMSAATRLHHYLTEP